MAVIKYRPDLTSDPTNPANWVAVSVPALGGSMWFTGPGAPDDPLDPNPGYPGPVTSDGWMPPPPPGRPITGDFYLNLGDPSVPGGDPGTGDIWVLGSGRGPVRYQQPQSVPPPEPISPVPPPPDPGAPTTFSMI